MSNPQQLLGIWYQKDHNLVSVSLDKIAKSLFGPKFAVFLSPFSLSTSKKRGFKYICSKITNVSKPSAPERSVHGNLHCNLIQNL